MKNHHRGTLRSIALLSTLAFAAGCGSDARPEWLLSDGPRGAHEAVPAQGSDPEAVNDSLSWDAIEAEQMAPTPSDDLAATASLDGLSSLRLYLTDAPVDLDEVWVNIASVEIGAGAGDASAWIPVMDEPRTLDLLDLQNGVTAILGDTDLAPGFYGQMRLVVESAEAVVDGETLPLFIPSSAQTGIKINLNFEAESDVDYALVLDFDAFESIKETGRGLMMTPVIKVQSLGAVGHDDVELVTESDAGVGTAGDVGLVAEGDAGAVAEGDVDTFTEGGAVAGDPSTQNADGGAVVAAESAGDAG